MTEPVSCRFRFQSQPSFYLPFKGWAGFDEENRLVLSPCGSLCQLPNEGTGRNGLAKGIEAIRFPQFHHNFVRAPVKRRVWITCGQGVREAHELNALRTDCEGRAPRQKLAASSQCLPLNVWGTGPVHSQSNTFPHTSPQSDKPRFLAHFTSRAALVAGTECFGPGRYCPRAPRRVSFGFRQDLRSSTERS